MRQCSPHALRRCAQRRVPEELSKLAVDWGQPIRQFDGRIAYHIGRRDAARAKLRGVYIPERATGVAVIIAPDGTVVTVIRTSDRSRLRAHGREYRRARRRGATR